MMLGVVCEEIRNQIVDAYTIADLEMVLREKMNVRLNEVVAAPATFTYTVFQLIRWAEQMGQLAELMQVLARARPEHAGMQSFYQKYGMDVPVVIQQGGQPLLPIPILVTESGFEAQLKRSISYLDVGLWREQLAGLEGRVCRIEVGDLKGTMGTGFLVGPDAILTNYHVLLPVIEDGSPASGVKCRFDFKKLANGNDSEGTVVGLHSEWQIDVSKFTTAEAENSIALTEPSPDELDYALIRLARPMGREPINPNLRPGVAGVPARGWVRVPESPPPMTPRMPILILQHPRSESLKLAMDTEGVTLININGTRVRYQTNTEDGSSGSPCFDIKWGLVALHHYGDPAFNAFTRKSSWNQGIPIAAIRTRLTRVGKAHFLGGEIA